VGSCHHDPKYRPRTYPMPERLFNSAAQRLLVSMYRMLSARLNLNQGVFGKTYRRAYFSYKHRIDKNLVSAAAQLAKPGTQVIDVGANIGFFSVALASRTDVTVLAFEPDRQNYENLVSVAVEFDLSSRIRPFMLALSDTTGVGSLFLSDLAPTDHKLINSRSSRAVEIEMIRLDDFFARRADFAKTPVSLIKIDVQGAELLVLRGMHQTVRINNYPPILVEYSPDDLAQAGTTPEEFFGAFEMLGYRPCSLPDLNPRHPDWFIKGTSGAYSDLAMIRSNP